MAALTDQTTKFADHIQRTLDLVFEVKVDASESLISGDFVGIGSFTDQANGEFDLDLSDLGDVEKLLAVEVVSASTGTATVSGSLSSQALSLSVNSNQDLTSQDVDLVIRVVCKRDL